MTTPATPADVRRVAEVWHKLAFVVWPDHRMDLGMPDRLQELARRMEAQS